MIYYENIKNMSIGEMSEFLANEAFIIWKSEHSFEFLQTMNETQIKCIKQHYYNYFHELLRREVEE